VVPSLKRKLIPSGIVMFVVMPGSASGNSLLAGTVTGSFVSWPNSRNQARTTRLLSGDSSSPTVAAGRPSQSKDDATSATPAPKLLVVSLRATSVWMSLFCLNHFFKATGILANCDKLCFTFINFDKITSRSVEAQQRNASSGVLPC
jgi:hypothetical protein